MCSTLPAAGAVLSRVRIATVAAGCKAVPMTRVSLSRLPGDRVLVVDGGAEHEVAVADLPAYVRAREADAPRWVWDDTARWYPPLLAAGVRVERCHDLRLGHHLLRRAPAVDAQLLEGEQSEHWDRLGPSTPSDPALFSIDDTAEHLRADLEDARQLAAVAASAEAARLGLLLAAESSGALVAAEMTYAGVPWRVDVHERLLTDLLGPRPPRGARPQQLEALVAEVRGAFGAPGLNPDSRPELLAALRRAGLDVTDTRASSLRALEHPGIVAAAALQAARAPVPDQRLGLDRPVGERRPVPAVVPAGRLHHRPVVVQRRRRAVVPGAGPARGRGRRRLDVRGRRRRPARATRARGHERRPRAGQAARGADLYQGMVDDGAVASRNDAKLGLLGAMYGATSGESGRMVAGLTRRYPRRLRPRRGGGPRRRAGPGGAHAARARVADPGRRVGPRPRRPAGRSRQPGPLPARVRPLHPQLRRAGHRRRVGAVLDRRPAQPALAPGRRPARSTARPHLVFFLHDEVVVHTPAALADAVAAQATEAAATAAGLLFRDLAIDFPLNISIVRSYADAGKPGVAADPADELVLSCEVRAVKPDPAIFEVAVERLGVLPGESLFVDDQPAFCRAAEAAGIRAVQIDRAGGQGEVSTLSELLAYV